jgi:hypothetical protein
MNKLPLSVLLALCSGGGGQLMPAPRAIPPPSDMPYRKAQREAKDRARSVKVLVAMGPSQRMKLAKARMRGEPQPRHAYPKFADKRARDGYSIAAWDSFTRARLMFDHSHPRVLRSPRRSPSAGSSGEVR